MEATVYGNATWSVERVGTLLYIVGKKRGFFYMGNGVGLRLWLPTRLALKLANVNASIQVRGDLDSLAASVVHGDIEIRAGACSEARLRAVHGRIMTHGVTSAFNIVTSPGDVRMVNCGGELKISATPGNVRLEQVLLTAGRSHSVLASPGNIKVRGIAAPSGLELRGKSTQPPITAELPDAETHNKGHRLHIKRVGPNPAKLYLDATGRLSIKG
jgi:hypothetical protein